MKKTVALAAALSLVSVLGLPSQALANALKPSSLTVVSTSTQNTAADEGTVRVSWPAVVSAVAYSVSGSAAGRADGESSIYSCNAGTCSATVAKLVGGVSYAFIVTAFGSGDSQAASDPVNFTARTIPNGPAALTPTASGGAVTLSWAAPTNTGGLALSGYEIEESAGAITKIVISNANASSYVVSGLSAGARYNFTIRSRNSLGLSPSVAFSAISATSAPNAPSRPTASAEGSTVTVTWTAPGDNGSAITGYKIFLVNPDTSQDVGQFTASLQSPAVINNVASGTYVAQVLATNGSGDGPRSIASTSVTIGSGNASNTPILNPAGLTSIGIGDSILVSATAPSGGNVSLGVVSSPAGACTLVSGTLRAVTNGSCTLNASVAGNARFAAGTLSREIVIKLAQTISFQPISGQSLPGPYTLSATASSNLTVGFTASGSCAVSGSQLTFIAAGGCSVTATQAGNNVFSAAPSITRTFVISGGSGGFGPPNMGLPGDGLAAPKASKIFTSKKAGPAKAVVLTKAKTKVSIARGQAVRVKLTGLPVGTRVSSVLRTKAGYEYFLSAAMVKANGKYQSPAIAPRKAGVYTIITTIGTESKTLRIRVK